ncbi:MAG: hypothetical protein ACRD9L_27650 [Bryobacteraceae bacterium]
MTDFRSSIDERFPVEEAPPPAGKSRILVIDDEADIRESLEALLTGEDYIVGMASTAAEGLRKV